MPTTTGPTRSSHHADADVLEGLLRHALSAIDGHAHQRHREQRGPRGPNPKGQSRQRLTRLPFEPLMTRGGYTSYAQLARATGITRDAIRSLRHGIPIHRADVIACRIGLHPAAVWGAEFYQSEYQVAS